MSFRDYEGDLKCLECEQTVHAKGWNRNPRNCRNQDKEVNLDNMSMPQFIRDLYPITLTYN